MIFKKGSAKQRSLFDHCLTCGKSVDVVSTRRALYATGTNRFLGYVHYDCSTPDWYPGKRP